MQGLYTAIITPFTPDGLGLDEAGLRENIAFQLQNGVDGIVALGTTGEAPTLSSEEKERVIAIAVEEIGGRVPLYVGTGSYSTAETIRQTKRAEALGADGALIITPYYNKPSQEGIYRHFSAVANETGLPIMLYNHPGRTGSSIELATLQRLAANRQIIGVKETSGKVSAVGEICAALPHFIVMSGDDPLGVESIRLGAKGVISVLGNLLPKEVGMLYREQSEELKNALQPFMDLIFIETNPVPIKAMMERAGRAAGPVRLPLCALSEENQKLINELTGFVCVS